MANITFLLGNGFDLNLGLNTSYRHFYQSLDKASNNSIIKNICKECNSDLWSDMEIGIGNILEHYSNETVDSFIDDFIELEDILTLYLEKENKRFKIEDESKVESSFVKRIQSINSILPEKYNGMFNRIMKSISEPIQYSFITFNYTDTVDSIVKTIAKNPSSFSHKFSTGGTASDKVSMPLHIHGKLRDLMVVGLNDESQINNPELRSNESLVSILVKSRANDDVGNFNTREARDLIMNSRIIYVYGLSLGATDMMWTQTLIEWLKSSTERLLVIDSYDEKYNRNCTSRVQKWKIDFFNRVVATNKIDRQVFDSVRNQICVIANSPTFVLEGIAVSNS